jgi:hypothetical protein
MSIHFFIRMIFKDALAKFIQLRPLYRRRDNRLPPLNTRQCGSMEGSGHFGAKENILLLLGIKSKFLGCPALKLVTATSPLYV